MLLYRAPTLAVTVLLACAACATGPDRTASRAPEAAALAAAATAADAEDRAALAGATSGPAWIVRDPDATRAGRVEALFARWDRPDSPGCAMGVVRGGELVHARGFGSANLDHRVPNTPRTVFYSASVSKQFTAGVLALMESQGLLSLDDDVRDHVPELPEYDRPITLRQMLNHTSGLRDYLQLMQLAGMRLEDSHSDDEVLELIVRQRALNFTPGSEFLYSNTGYFLVSVIVPRVTGLSLREFADRHLFAPLGMRDTHFHDDRDMIVQGRAMAYARSGEDYRVSYWYNFDKVGSGGLLTTVEDLVRWERNMANPTVGGPALIETLQRPGRLSDGSEIDYMLGLSRGEYRGIRTVGHSGGSMGFRAHFVRAPEEDFAALLLCNTAEADPARLAREVMDIHLEHRLAPAVERGIAAATPPADEPVPAAVRERLRPRIGDYTGRYHSPELAADYVVRLLDGELRLLPPRSDAVPLVPAADDEFRAGPFRVRFLRGADDAVTGFTLESGRVRGLRFERAERARAGRAGG